MSMAAAHELQNAQKLYGAYAILSHLFNIYARITQSGHLHISVIFVPHYQGTHFGRKGVKEMGTRKITNQERNPDEDRDDDLRRTGEWVKDNPFGGKE